LVGARRGKPPQHRLYKDRACKGEAGLAGHPGRHDETQNSTPRVRSRAIEAFDIFPGDVK